MSRARRATKTRRSARAPGMRTCVCARDKSRIGLRTLSSGSADAEPHHHRRRGAPAASVSLADALTIVTQLAQKHDPRYGRAAARWVARVVLERRLDLGDARRLLSLVDELPRTPGLGVTLNDYT
jgi:hypothetical protein